jgi:hypothetical protein
MFHFQPSLESLETRETPSVVTGRITAIAADPASSDGSSGPGVYKTMDGGATWTLAPDSGTATKSDPLPVLLVIADRRY